MSLQKLQTELQLRAFSPQTVRAYLYWNNDFLKNVKKQPEEIIEVAKIEARLTRKKDDTKNIHIEVKGLPENDFEKTFEIMSMIMRVALRPHMENEKGKNEKR